MEAVNVLGASMTFPKNRLFCSVALIFRKVVIKGIDYLNLLDIPAVHTSLIRLLLLFRIITIECNKSPIM